MDEEEERKLEVLEQMYALLLEEKLENGMRLEYNPLKEDVLFVAEGTDVGFDEKLGILEAKLNEILDKVFERLRQEFSNVKKTDDLSLLPSSKAKKEPEAPKREVKLKDQFLRFYLERRLKEGMRLTYEPLRDEVVTLAEGTDAGLDEAIDIVEEKLFEAVQKRLEAIGEKFENVKKSEISDPKTDEEADEEAAKSSESDEQQEEKKSEGPDTE